MIARSLLVTAALAAASALAAPPAHGAPCPGLTDPRGDSGIMTNGDRPIAALPGASFDIVRGSVTVGKTTTTFRVQLADLADYAVEAAAGANWDFEIRTARDYVYVSALVLPNHARTSVSRGVPGEGVMKVYNGPAATIRIADDTVSWTVPTAVLTKAAGLTDRTVVSPRIRSWRAYGVGVAGDATMQPVLADTAAGAKKAWARAAC